MKIQNIPLSQRDQAWHDLCRLGTYYRGMAVFFSSVSSDKDKDALGAPITAFKKLLRNRHAYRGGARDMAMLHMDMRINEVKEYAKHHPILLKQWENLLAQQKKQGHL
ncbi:MAG: hypothetical protein IJV07_02520 [Alphaproteobacteria bacterium]|nr:hypothetical protein [Alphaproteobacteria bacterium]